MNMVVSHLLDIVGMIRCKVASDRGSTKTRSIGHIIIKLHDIQESATLNTETRLLAKKQQRLSRDISSNDSVEQKLSVNLPIKIWIASIHHSLLRSVELVDLA